MEETEKPKVKKIKKPKTEKVEKVEKVEEPKLSEPPKQLDLPFTPVEIVPEEPKKEESKEVKDLDEAGKSIGKTVGESENKNFLEGLWKSILDLFK
jgi:hypothetical protein